MKLLKILSLLTILALLLCACTTPTDILIKNAVNIELSDSKITLDGETVKNNSDSPVYIANDIIYYESGKDFTYGEGTEKDAHTKEEADAHTVLHITKAGTYTLSGKLSFGQIAIDLGGDAKEDPKAIVTLILNNLDITCTVAPAVIFYNVYECGNIDEDNATKNVDTKKAGANVIIADGTKNTVNGSYVEKIYKPDSIVLNADGTEVEDAKKLHKYDGALYSKMSMNIDCQKGTGSLNINAVNEGLDSELHLTINGGNINIKSGNDGINTNEDGISVTTINGGELNIQVTGETGEGDGIDSNGWLVINGGSVTAMACSTSGDAGIDSDMGIHINGGTVIATGSMLDRIESTKQNYAVFNFSSKQNGTTALQLKNSQNKNVLDFKAQNAFSILIYSSPNLKTGSYTLFSNGKQQQGQSGGGMMGGSGMRPEGMTPPEGFDGMEPPQNRPPVEGNEPPTGQTPPPKPEGQNGGLPSENNNDNQPVGELSSEFKINSGANILNNISQVKQPKMRQNSKNSTAFIFILFKKLG